MTDDKLMLTNIADNLKGDLNQLTREQMLFKLQTIKTFVQAGQEMNEENPDFICVVYLLGCYHVNLMKWDNRADDYVVHVSKNCGDSKTNATVLAVDWAREEGLEYRK